MTEVVILTPAQADKVRGLSPSKEGHALIPVETDDGNFKLGVGVLEAPAFAHVREFLANLPRGEDRPPKEATEEAVEADSAARMVVWSDKRPHRRETILAEVRAERAAELVKDTVRGR